MGRDAHTMKSELKALALVAGSVMWLCAGAWLTSSKGGRISQSVDGSLAVALLIASLALPYCGFRLLRARQRTASCCAFPAFLASLVPPVMILCAALVALLVPRSADVTKLPADQRKVLQNSARFHEVHTTTNLPPAVVALCSDDNGRLAEPGQKWEATDLITDSTLPCKRLIWAASGGGYCVVHYERCGRGHSFHVLVAICKQGDSKAKVVWRAVGHQLEDYSAFLVALEKNQLDNRLEYAH